MKNLLCMMVLLTQIQAEENPFEIQKTFKRIKQEQTSFFMLVKKKMLSYENNSPKTDIPKEPKPIKKTEKHTKIQDKKTVATAYQEKQNVSVLVRESKTKKSIALKEKNMKLKEKKRTMLRLQELSLKQKKLAALLRDQKKFLQKNKKKETQKAYEKAIKVVNRED